MMALIEFDGACEPNPGGVATAGWHVFFVDLDYEKLMWSDSTTIFQGGPNATNNAAEWCALGFALRQLRERPLPENITELRIRGDSQLVIKQLTGEWECRQERMRRYRDRCLELLEHIGMPWKAAWIPREDNRADELSRQQWEKTTGKEFPERIKKK